MEGFLLARTEPAAREQPESGSEKARCIEHTIKGTLSASSTTIDLDRAPHVSIATSSFTDLVVNINFVQIVFLDHPLDPVATVRRFPASLSFDYFVDHSNRRSRSSKRNPSSPSCSRIRRIINSLAARLPRPARGRARRSGRDSSTLFDESRTALVRNTDHSGQNHNTARRGDLRGARRGSSPGLSRAENSAIPAAPHPMHLTSIPRRRSRAMLGVAAKVVGAAESPDDRRRVPFDACSGIGTPPWGVFGAPPGDAAPDLARTTRLSCSETCSHQNCSPPSSEP